MRLFLYWKAGILMLNDYLYLKKDYDRLIYLSNILHDIKYDKNIDGLYIKYSDIDLSSADKFAEHEFTELCVLATYIEQAFNNKGLPGPEWVKDKRLFLSEPKFFLHNSADVVLHATQACLNHNVFLAKSDFDVC